MRLSAVYIPQNTLPHIFGDDHKGQTINLGGKYFYNINDDKGSIVLKSRILNENFIENFWGNNISNISAIVGRNGAGKTSILRALNHSGDSNHKHLIYIFEEKDEGVLILNESQERFEISPQKLMSGYIDRKNLDVQYYSPVLDFELSDALSSIALVKYHQENLEEYFLDSVIRNLYLLNDPVIDIITEIYPDFPRYNHYSVRVAKNKKTKFQEVYILSNFANPHKGDALKNHIQGEISKIDNYPKDITREQLKEIFEDHLKFLEGESFNDLFHKIWDLEPYKTRNNYDLIHDSKDFLKDFEVTILSYEILGAVFPQTGLGGSYDFQNILKSESFEERLNRFLELYLANEDKLLYEKIKDKLPEISVAHKDEIKKIISADHFSKLSGVDTKPIRQRMIKDVNRIYYIYVFYNYLIKLFEESVLKEEDGDVTFNVKGDITVYEVFFQKYKTLLDFYNHIPRKVSILSFVPNKKLSTGEKSLIDFYASLYNYIESHRKNKDYRSKHYLMLLDEPELGYHPLWKKKFIQAIVKTLPALFANISAGEQSNKIESYVGKNAEIPNIQIIFTTHDPLTLSDIPTPNIVYLDKEENKSIITGQRCKSFAANITDLLADSFFVEDGLIGDFAKQKIDDTITWLLDKENMEDADYHKILISNIDEPIIQRKVSEMYSEKMKDTLSKDLLKREIDNLRAMFKDRYNEEL
jgi:energy-coupling factor transporter ATP-binding protein EcfA2